MLEKPEAITNEHNPEKLHGNIGYTKNKTKTNKIGPPPCKKTHHSIICVEHHYTQTNTNNVDKPPTNNWRCRGTKYGDKHHSTELIA